jgi:hypothetical protein
VVILEGRRLRYTLGKGLVGSQSCLDGAEIFVPNSMKFALIELSGMMMMMVMMIVMLTTATKAQKFIPKDVKVVEFVER